MLLPAIAAFVACTAPSASAQRASDMGVVQDFVLGAIFGEETEMRAQLAPDAKLMISDGVLLASGKASKPAIAADVAEFGKFFLQCQFKMSIGSLSGVFIDICTTGDPAKRRLVKFEVRDGKITSATMSRGWAKAPVTMQLPGRP